MTMAGVVPPIFRWGADFTWGNGWYWGYGGPDPWVPCDTPLTHARFAIEKYTDLVPTFTIPGSLIYAIDNTGTVTRHFDAGGSIPNETFYLESPNGTWFAITANGTTGAQTVTPVAGPSSHIGLQLPSPDGRLWYYLVFDDGSLILGATVQWFSSGGAHLTAIDNTGLLTTRFNVDGSVPDEMFSLQSPNGTWWTVTIQGTTGNLVVTQAGPTPQLNLYLPSPDGRLWAFLIDNTGTLMVSPTTQLYTKEPAC